MAMSVHQPWHQQLSAIADDADTGILGCDCSKRSRFPNRAVHDHNCACRDHAGCSEARIGDHVCAPHDDGLSHSFAPLQFGTPAVAWTMATYSTMAKEEEAVLVREKDQRFETPLLQR